MYITNEDGPFRFDCEVVTLRLLEMGLVWSPFLFQGVGALADHQCYLLREKTQFVTDPTPAGMKNA